MPTSTFTLAQSGAVVSGYWSGPSNNGGHTSYAGGGRESQLDGTFTGTQADFYTFCNTTSDWQISVDGGAYAVPTQTSGVWGFQTFASGLTDATHTYRLKFNGSKNPYLDISTNGMIRVTGASPAAGAPTDPTLTGTQYVCSANAAALLFEGGFAQTSAGNYPTVYNVQTWQDGALGLRTACTGAVRLWTFCNGSKYQVIKDGADTGTTVTLPSTNRYDWVTMATGDGALHTWRFASVSNNGGEYAWAWMVCGGTLDATYSSARLPLVAYGDSITQGTTGTSGNSWAGFVARAAQSLGLAAYNLGINSTTTKQFASGAASFTALSGQARYTDVTGIASPKAVLIFYGHNDQAQAGGAETASDLQAAYQAMLTSILAHESPAATPVYCFGILPWTGTTPSSLATWNAAVQAAVTAVAAASVAFVDTSGWGLLQNNGASSNYTDPSANSADGTHYNSQGCAIIAAKIVSLLSPAPVAIPNAFLPAHLRAPRGRTRVGPGVKTH